jgi:hypothetical protein
MTKFIINWDDGTETTYFDKGRIELSEYLFKFADKNNYTQKNLVSIKTSRTTIYERVQDNMEQPRQSDSEGTKQGRTI